MRRKVDELWDWAWREGQDAKVEAPQTLHSLYPTPEDRSELPLNAAIERRPSQKPLAGVIVGRPFTRRFERFLDGERTLTPARRALFRLKPPRKDDNGKKVPLPFDFQVVWAIMEGGHETAETVAAVLWTNVERVEAAALALLPSVQKLAELIEIEDDHNRGDHAQRMKEACPICRRLLEGAA